MKPYHKPLLTGSPARQIPRSDGLIEYRESSTNDLLCLFDPKQRMILIKHRRGNNRIELSQTLDNPAEIW